MKLPILFFREQEQKISQFVWKHKKPWIAKDVLRKKNGTDRINLPDYRLYYKAIVKMIAWYQHKNRNIDQWNMMESLEINTHTYRHLIFDEERIYNGENIVSSTTGVEKAGQLHENQWGWNTPLHYKSKHNII